MSSGEDTESGRVTHWKFVNFPSFLVLSEALNNKSTLKLEIEEFDGHVGNHFLRKTIADFRITNIIDCNAEIGQAFVLGEMECEHAKWSGIQTIVSKEATNESQGRKTFQYGSFKKTK